MTNTNNSNKYFSFANTHAGTISYVNEIFSPQKFDRIYIIKGFYAQNFITHLKSSSGIDRKYSCDYFMNPINPQRTDGIIINKTAVINGSLTEIEIDDCHFPALIVNLNEFCDESLLALHRDKIIKLSEKRQELQVSAQRCLKAANELVEYLLDLSVEYLDEKKLSSAIDRILHKRDALIHNNDENDYRFINSSVGNELNTLECDTNKTFSISNEYFCGFHFMKALAVKINDSKMICPDALNTKRTHAIYIKKDNILFKLQTRFDKKADDEKYSYINMERFIHHAFRKDHKQKLKFIKKIHDSLISEAADCFNELKNISTALEEIYSPSINHIAQKKFAMDFMKKL